MHDELSSGFRRRDRGHGTAIDRSVFFKRVDRFLRTQFGVALAGPSSEVLTFGGVDRRCEHAPGQQRHAEETGQGKRANQQRRGGIEVGHPETAGDPLNVEPLRPQLRDGGRQRVTEEDAVGPALENCHVPCHTNRGTFHVSSPPSRPQSRSASVRTDQVRSGWPSARNRSAT